MPRAEVRTNVFKGPLHSSVLGLRSLQSYVPLRRVTERERPCEDIVRTSTGASLLTSVSTPANTPSAPM